MFNDEDRRYVYETLEANMGRRMAELVMGHLPPAGWADLATRTDLAALGSELRGEMAEVRGEMAQLRGELKGEMAELRGEVAELRGEMRSMLPKLIAANIASGVGVAGLVLAAVSIGG